MFFKEVSYANHGCIYLLKITVKIVILLLQFTITVFIFLFEYIFYVMSFRFGAQEHVLLSLLKTVVLLSIFCGNHNTYHSKICSK